jgi:hypothetical protein
MNIHDKIYEIRGQKVMLDFDLGELKRKGINQKTLIINRMKTRHKF